MVVNLYALETHEKWRAEKSGKLELFFDCGECLAKGPEIYGFLGKSAKYHDIIIFKRDEGFYPALLCKNCFERYEKRVKTVGGERE
jgi:hypothetical protein